MLSPAVSLPVYVHMNVSSSSPRLSYVGIQGDMNKIFHFFKSTFAHQENPQLIIHFTSTYNTEGMISVIYFVILREVVPK